MGLEQYPVGFGFSLTKEGKAPHNKLIRTSAKIMVWEEDGGAAPGIDRELTGGLGLKLRQPLITGLIYEQVHPKLAADGKRS